MKTPANADYKVIVHFATSSYERVVASYPTYELAQRRIREYQGADARGLWIEHPDGTREVVSVR